MATVQCVKRRQSFNYHTLCNVFDEDLDGASGDAGANALIERESGFLGKCGQRKIESILKDTASRYSTDCYRLLKVGRSSSQRTAGAVLVSARNGEPDRSAAKASERNPTRPARMRYMNIPGRTGQRRRPVRQFIPVRTTPDSKSASRHTMSCGHRMQRVCHRR